MENIYTTKTHKNQSTANIKPKEIYKANYNTMILECQLTNLEGWTCLHHL